MLATDEVDLSLLTDVLGFEAHDEQMEVLKSPHRFILVAGGIRSGKSELAGAKFMVNFHKDLAEKSKGVGDGSGEPLLYWLIAADYERNRKEFEVIGDHLTSMFGVNAVQGTTGRIDPGAIKVQIKGERKPRVLIETKSAKDPRTIAMKAPHGIIVCEASQIDLNTYERLDGRTAEHKAWLFMSGTFETSLGWYPGLWRAWQAGIDNKKSFSIPTYSNWHIFPGGRQDPEILRLEREHSGDYFEEQLMGRPVPPKGMVFHEFRADVHVKPVEYQPGKPVYLMEDPGYGSDSAHALYAAHLVDWADEEHQAAGYRPQLQIFDGFYTQGIITRDVIGMVMNTPWWQDVDSIVSDPFYKDQHHSQTSVSETWTQEAHMTPVTIERIKIAEADERFKSFLKIDPLTGHANMVINARCTGLLSELGACPNPFDGQTRVYSWKYDRDGTLVGRNPDEGNNHGIRAVEYFLISRFGYGYSGKRNKIPVGRWGKK